MTLNFFHLRHDNDPRITTGAVDEAGVMKIAAEQLKADDGVNDDDEEHQQSDVQQRNHRFEDGIQHHLKTCTPHTDTRSIRYARLMAHHSPRVALASI